eukprot:m51a1_g859 hypothetical protein (573) ;mRNA; r:799692-801475
MARPALLPLALLALAACCEGSAAPLAWDTSSALVVAPAVAGSSARPAPPHPYALAVRLVVCSDLPVDVEVRAATPGGLSRAVVAFGAASRGSRCAESSALLLASGDPAGPLALRLASPGPSSLVVEAVEASVRSTCEGGGPEVPDECVEAARTAAAAPVRGLADNGPHPDCSRHASQGQCANATGCVWCEPTGQCQPAQVWCLPCKYYGRECPKKGCEYCKSLEYCAEPADDCPRCTEVLKPATCSKMQGCDWCMLTQSCADENKCLPCENATTEAACLKSALHAGCVWCLGTAECKPSHYGCGLCPDLNAFECQRQLGCTWCASESHCIPMTETCLTCADAVTPGDCSRFADICQWCASSIKCAETPIEYCETCSNVLSQGVCDRLPGCMWCAATKNCTAIGHGCPSCYEIKDQSGCPGCSWCPSADRCQAPGIPCMQCDWLTRPACDLYAGCDWCNGTCIDGSHCPNYSSSASPSPVASCRQWSDCTSCTDDGNCHWCYGDVCLPVSEGKPRHCVSMCIKAGWMYLSIGLGGVVLIVVATVCSFQIAKCIHKRNQLTTPLLRKTDKPRIN